MKCIECPYMLCGWNYETRKAIPLGCTLLYVKNNFYKGNDECSLTYDEISKINELTKDVMFPQVPEIPVDVWKKINNENFIEYMALIGKEEVERMNKYIKELKEKGR